jgi:hypothetical protein
VPNPQPVSAMEQCFHTASLTDRWQDGLRIIFMTLFLPQYEDWIGLNLPTCLVFLYYPLRMVRLLKKYASPAA